MGIERNERKRSPELLAPAGDRERLEAAVRFGADAVYLGGSAFGMRAAPANFTFDELRCAVEYAHERGVRVYLACNTLPRNAEIDALPAFLTAWAECGVDAFIITDLGVLELARRYAPPGGTPCFHAGRDRQLRRCKRFLCTWRKADCHRAGNVACGDRRAAGAHAGGACN